MDRYTFGFLGWIDQSLADLLDRQQTEALAPVVIKQVRDRHLADAGHLRSIGVRRLPAVPQSDKGTDQRSGVCVGK